MQVTLSRPVSKMFDISCRTAGGRSVRRGKQRAREVRHRVELLRDELPHLLEFPELLSRP